VENVSEEMRLLAVESYSACVEKVGEKSPHLPTFEEKLIIIPT
jgi:hypothetical protein